MFSRCLQEEFSLAHIGQEDIAFIGDVAVRFPEVKKNFEQFARIPAGERRVQKAVSTLKETVRRGWHRIGIPMGDPQTVAEHERTGAVFSLVIYPEHNAVSEMFKVHDHSETIVTDFTPVDPITKDEKYKLEKLGLEFILAKAPTHDGIMTQWLEYEAQVTPTSHKAFDVDKLEMILQAQVYELRYPDLKERLEEFWDYVEPRLKTPEGRSFFKFLQEQHPEPHPLKLQMLSMK